MKLGVKVHATQFKQSLLTHFTDTHHDACSEKGRGVLIAFEEDVGTALAKACELDSANDTIHL